MFHGAGGGCGGDGGGCGGGGHLNDDRLRIYRIFKKLFHFRLLRKKRESVYFGLNLFPLFKL
jgi:hypothetical protein